MKNEYDGFRTSDGWSWDFVVTEKLTQDGKPRLLKILGYMLDNVYERMRYLTGGRWSKTLGKHRYVGISVARAIKSVWNEDW